MFQNTTLHFFSNTEKMLKSINNNTSSFSMDNLLSREKLSPEIDRSSDDDRQQLLESIRNSRQNFKFHQDAKLSASPTDNTRSEGESDRLTPTDKNEVFLRFNNCLKNRMCSNCGRFDCNYFQCRVQGENLTIKDTKPVLKFSVSAILGNDHQQQKTSIQNGKC